MEYLSLKKEIIDNKDFKKLREIEQFLLKQGLRLDKNIEYTIAVYDEDKIVATGSFENSILKCIAVDKNYRGMGISNKIISELVAEEYVRGNNHLFIYTKPDNYNTFGDMGFYKVAQVPGEVILLENDPCAVGRFVENLKKKRVDGKVVSAIVMNCNPFTLGHEYLIEKASKESDIVHVFIVWENKSVFPSNIRYELARNGIRHLNNVILHKGKDYVISSATFPSYFIKRRDKVTRIQALLDIEIFTKYIVPALGITRRYIGEEPFCDVTAIYNNVMKEVLSLHGIEIVEIPRFSKKREIVSASKVRELIRERKFSQVKELVPDSTYSFLCSKKAIPIIDKIQNK
ncbi:MULTISPECIES: [citrate (pro-3S)-lyase] ligase [Clostridium]|uniref:[Citrate [pro-3S]-lyase] ligase n=1 Tax=Clostridium lapidicellarium TaxID=3240931 RepID=A0ABV4DYJ2_9CLOT|nr:[citrate (pro-3S)-lyase] ligase [Clostridiales bacterium]